MNEAPRISYSSETWKRLEHWAQEELRLARQRNDIIEQSAERTAAIRGEIAVLKRILDLPEAAAREAGAAPDQ